MESETNNGIVVFTHRLQLVDVPNTLVEMLVNPRGSSVHSSKRTPVPREYVPCVHEVHSCVAISRYCPAVQENARSQKE